MSEPRAPRPKSRLGARARDAGRTRALAVGALALALAAVLTIFVDAYAGSSHAPARTARQRRVARRSRRRAPPAFAVGTTTVHLVDTSRTITLPEGRDIPRPLETIVRYPAVGGVGGEETPGATPATAKGPYPLIVFGHGFDATPSTYAALLNRWTRAGYVVAAPVFPLENAAAPGGATQADLPNEPADFSFVITHLLEESERGAGPLAHLIEANHIAVAGQGDGGDAALATAYDPAMRDQRIDAAAILSGSEIPQLGQFTFPSSGPALLATQGLDDTINTPDDTYLYFDAAPKPKYLLRIGGGEQLAPYTSDPTQLALVERVTVAFFDAYLRGSKTALNELQSVGNLGAAGSLLAEP
ncbi:MAG TPA: hypothetical protein VMA83_00895 [Solirubrobacteraceae bacterium]|nr:hypothetical protein [Solirubrobacteraceae bacterium]